MSTLNANSLPGQRSEGSIALEGQQADFAEDIIGEGDRMGVLMLDIGANDEITAEDLAEGTDFDKDQATVEANMEEGMVDEDDDDGGQDDIDGDDEDTDDGKEEEDEDDVFASASSPVSLPRHPPPAVHNGNRILVTLSRGAGGSVGLNGPRGLAQQAYARQASPSPKAKEVIQHLRALRP